MKVYEELELPSFDNEVYVKNVIDRARELDTDG